MRLFSLLLAAFTGAISLSSAALADTVSLRADPVASAQAVTLGDLFEGAGRAGGVAVATAPRGGLSTVLDAGAVQSAAAQAGLEWSNPTGLRRIIVRSAGAPAGVARAATPTAATASPAPAAGAEVLVWARNINSGEVIAAEDLSWGRAVAPQDAIADPDAVIGQAARRPLRMGAAATARDTSAQQVIARGETVQVDWRDGGLTLTIQGQAQASAAAGQALRVLNPASRRVIDTVATGPGRAVAGPEAERLRAQLLTNPAAARLALR